MSGAKNDSGSYTSAALSLTLPGSVLNMSSLVYLKKFRYMGNKAGGLRGWEMLQEVGLGSVIESKAMRGTDKVRIMLYIISLLLIAFFVY